jgi:cell division protein FtsI (penicillin-binding protein 3)
MPGFRRNPSPRPPSRIVRVENRALRGIGESRLRSILIACFFALCFGMLGIRLIEVSTLGGGDLPFKRLVSEPQLLLQREDDVDVSKVGERERAIRREIVDRNGLTLATSIKTASLVANPTIIRHEREVAAALTKIFPRESQAALEEKLNRKHATFIYIARHLSPAQQEAVNNLGVPGLFFEPDVRRVYPYGGLFSHSLGYVGVDNQGLAGIEKYFDAQLEDPVVKEPLQLALDLRVQSILRDEIQAAITEFSAIGGIGVILDVTSGEVVAMTSLPEFDPHQPARATDEAKFNRVTLGAYEMGSTFKTFTVAAALEYDSTTMQGGYDARFPIKQGGFTINDTHPEGRWLTTPEIFAYSSNIGTAKMALDLGSKKQRAFLQALGMFAPVSIEVPELARPLTPKHWSELTTMTVSYGHGISVSPLHLVNAVAAITGDGHLKPMTLLKGGNKGKHEGDAVVSADTVQEVRQLLRLVALHGTGKKAEAPGYEVGGKTGTAEKITNGVYHADAKVASFVGVFPASNPRYAILVMVDEPKGTKATFGYATGGWVSAPVVGRVVQRMAPLLAMQPNFTPPDASVEALWIRGQQNKNTAVVAQEQKLQKEAIRAASF